MKTVLMTRRAMLQPATANDLPMLTTLWNDVGVRDLFFDGQAVTPTHARRLLDAGLADTAAGLGWWLVHPWSSAAAVGCVGLLRSQVAARAFSQPGEAVETLIAFSPEAWAQGYAQEATTELIWHAIYSLALPRLSVLSGVPDPTFDALLRKLGFEQRLEADAGGRRLRLHELTAATGRRAYAHAAQRWGDLRQPAPVLRSAHAAHADPRASALASGAAHGAAYQAAEEAADEAERTR